MRIIAKKLAREKNSPKYPKSLGETRRSISHLLRLSGGIILSGVLSFFLPGGITLLLAATTPQTVPATGQVPVPIPPSDNATLDQDLVAAPKGTKTSSGVVFTLLPNQDPFTPLLADPTQPTSHVSYFGLSNTAYPQFDGTFGADIGIVRWESPTAGINKSIQIGLMGATFSRFALMGPTQTTYLEDADYMIGLPVTFRWNKFSTRLYFYHESSHTGYNFTQMTGISKASDFGNEILQLIPSWDFNRHIRLYGGAAYRVFGFGNYSSAQDSTILISGLELYTSSLPSISGRAYMAFNLESRGINGYTPDEDLQLGLLFHRPGSYAQIRPAVDFFNGYTTMGDLIFNKEHYVSLGVYIDF